MIWIGLPQGPRNCPHLCPIYRRSGSNVVIFVFLLVFVFEYDLFFGVIDGRLEDLVRPLVLSAPVVVFIAILEVVIADIRVTIRDAYVDSFVF